MHAASSALLSCYDWCRGMGVILSYASRRTIGTYKWIQRGWLPIPLPSRVNCTKPASPLGLGPDAAPGGPSLEPLQHQGVQRVHHLHSQPARVEYRKQRRNEQRNNVSAVVDRNNQRLMAHPPLLPSLSSPLPNRHVVNSFRASGQGLWRGSKLRFVGCMSRYLRKE